MMKIEGSASGSGSTPKCHGSATLVGTLWYVRRGSINQQFWLYSWWSQVPSPECAAAGELPDGQHAPSLRHVRAGWGRLVRPTPEPRGWGQLSQIPHCCERKEYAKIPREGNDRRKRRKLRFVEGNAKCRHLKKLPIKREFAADFFICLRPRTLSPPPYTLYTCTGIRYTY